MSTPLSFGRDVQGYNAYAPMPCTNNYSVTLAAATATSITVPSTDQVWIASFNYSAAAKVYVDFSGATAAVPAGATLVATTSTLNPGQRTVLAGSKISIISAAIADVVIELYPTNY
jgi:hypothetical protein